MRILLTSLVYFTFLSFSYGQEVKKEEHSKEAAVYCCIKKDYCGEKGKKCPKCTQPLIKEGLYYCPKCAHTGKKSAYCAPCSMVMVKMERKSETVPEKGK